MGILMSKLAKSGQTFRILSTEIEDEWMVYSMERCVIVVQNPDDTIHFKGDKMKKSDYEYWCRYFDLSTDYTRIQQHILEAYDGNEFVKHCVEYGSDVPILCQNPFETIVSFMMSSTNSIPNIKSSIAYLCNCWGEYRVMTCTDDSGDLCKYPYYTFPFPEQLKDVTEAQLREKTHMGFRVAFIYKFIQEVLQGKHSYIYDTAGWDSQSIHSDLLSITGIGDKIAACVMLYGFHDLDSFPIDTWVKKIIQNEFNGKYDRSVAQPYNGILQQYMYDYYREHTEAYQ